MEQSPASERTSTSTNSIPLGSLSVNAFCRWIRAAPRSMQNALVTDVAWWAETDTLLKHQCIFLQLRHTPPDSGSDSDAPQPEFYDVKIERLGKHFPSISRLATDTVTIEAVPAERAWDSRLLENHTLFFAMVTHLGFVFPRDPSAPRIYFHRAFADIIDQRRQGPPLHLATLGRYLEVFSAQNPRYTLSSSNCFWYARLTFHVIALRHYSFPILATSFPPEKYLIPRLTFITIPENDMVQIIREENWLQHDPSSSGHVFRFLHYEELRNGTLMYRRLMHVVVALVMLCAGMASAYGWYRLFLPLKLPQPIALAIGCSFFLTVLGLSLSHFIARGAVRTLTRWHIRQQMEKLVRNLGQDEDYIPLKIPLTSILDDEDFRHPRWRSFVPEREPRIDADASMTDHAMRRKIKEDVSGLEPHTPVTSILSKEAYVHSWSTSGKPSKTSMYYIFNPIFPSSWEADKETRQKYLQILVAIAETPEGAEALVHAGTLLLMPIWLCSSPVDIVSKANDLLERLSGHPGTASAIGALRQCLQLKTGDIWPKRVVIQEIGFKREEYVLVNQAFNSTETRFWWIRSNRWFGP
ncbi:hypothetical protein C8F01DRAFT_1161965 [Mycena amicta]|nr:hypothetical protein C8F01DRAFT_1161965 [Mycena amicta]